VIILEPEKELRITKGKGRIMNEMIRMMINFDASGAIMPRNFWIVANILLMTALRLKILDSEALIP